MRLRALVFALSAVFCCATANAQFNLMLLRTNPSACSMWLEGYVTVSGSSGGNSDTVFPVDWYDDDEVNEAIHAYAGIPGGSAEAIGLGEATSSTGYNLMNELAYVNSFSGALGSVLTPPGGTGSSTVGGNSRSYNTLAVQPVSGVTYGLLKGSLSVQTSGAEPQSENQATATVAGVSLVYELSHHDGPAIHVYVNNGLVHTSWGAVGARVEFEQVVPSNATFQIESQVYCRGFTSGTSAYIEQSASMAAVEVEGIEDPLPPPVGIGSIKLWREYPDPQDDDDEPIEI